MNPLYSMMGSGNLPGNMGQILKQFQDFKRTFSGDPRQQVQGLLNSGKISQEQYNQAVQMANQLQQMLR